jgi:transcriptional regulator with XRE-family HTH domain
MPLFGETLRDFRKKRGLSLRGLESCAATSRSHLSDIERGLRLPSAALAKHLDQVLEANGELAAIALQTPKEADMRRRDILAALTAVTTGVAIAAPLASLEATRQAMAAAVESPSDADEWQAILGEYSRTYEHAEKAHLVQTLSADLAVLQRIIDANNNEHVQRELCRSAAQLCTIMALALGGSSQAYLARRWWRTANRAADRSGDAEVVAWVRGRETVRGLYERRPPAEMIVLADRCLSTGHPPWTGTMELLAGKAQALSMLGRTSEAKLVLGELDEVFSRLPASVTNDDSLHGWPEYRLWHTRSYVSTHLSDTTTAYAAQENALSRYPATMRWQAAMVRLHRARCLVLDGSPADGLVAANAALAALPERHHAGPVAELGLAVLTALPARERGREDAGELRQRLAPPVT